MRLTKSGPGRRGAGVGQLLYLPVSSAGLKTTGKLSFAVPEYEYRERQAWNRAALLMTSRRSDMSLLDPPIPSPRQPQRLPAFRPQKAKPSLSSAPPFLPRPRLAAPPTDLWGAVIVHVLVLEGHRALLLWGVRLHGRVASRLIPRPKHHHPSLLAVALQQVERVGHTAVTSDREAGLLYLLGPEVRAWREGVLRDDRVRVIRPEALGGVTLCSMMPIDAFSRVAFTFVSRAADTVRFTTPRLAVRKRRFTLLRMLFAMVRVPWARVR
eukprot:CAMPEP_0206028746 /NCGR_PEP_ID=MMETSP1464-20131121/45480_1 /ASSEMBLY_ACC=CAM_ASM_001124 /TAXON_ID=119497 /ORGANISM="Exanthemachrysis gayraliae, Strain RCC1523" /LENGTH=267 /DNA_ID=CAMNT_0053402819 /DNA_START=11 /DNA_END=811 /DNA_ORIENTATION=+